jgi:hypothetical protein
MAHITTFCLAILIGAVTIATGIGGWRRPKAWETMFDEFERSPGLTLAVAFVAILFGTLVLLLAGGWSGGLATALSVIGLASLAEGLILLAVPDLYLGLMRPALRFARPWSAFAILLGALLLIAGLLGIF